MLVLGIRAIILYVLVIVVMRIMGKGELGQLQPYEFVLVILIADLVSVPMEDISVPLMAGIVPLISVAVVEILISYLALKNEKFRTAVSGAPSVVIMHGRIVENELRHNRITITDLFEQLRLQGFSDISDVEFAIMETSGKLSVIAAPAKAKRPPKRVLPTTLILDGHLVKKNLTQVKLSESDLRREIRQAGFQNYEEVFLAYLESTGELYIQGYNQQTKEGKM